MLKDVANLRGVPFETFRQPWRASGVERNMGGFQSMEEQLAYVSAVLEYTPSATLLAETASRYTESRRLNLQPRTSLVETLQELQSVDLLRGLICNCSFVDRNLFPGSEIAPHIDVPVLSDDVGLLKPDPRIFQLACKRLGLQPEDCLYVGDGGSNELTAAKEAGMNSVLIRVPYHDGPAGNELREGEHWTGPRITSIPEVMALLEQWL
jgi:putative hydrolase of the HAD superfamily